MGRRARVELRYNSPGSWIHLFWFLSCFLLLWYFALIKKNIFLVLEIIYFIENSLFRRCFLEGGTPLFGLDGNVPLSRAWFSGSWRGILYNNVKVVYKQSTFVIPTIFDQKIQFGQDVSLKTTYFCMWNKMNQGPNIWSLFLSRVWVWRPRRQNFTQTFLRYDVFLEISEHLDWSAMSCSYFC